MDIFKAISEIDEKVNKIKEGELYNFNSSISSGGKEFSNKVPWNRNAPGAMNNDFDNDGIPNALDNFFGMGAEHDK